MSVSEMVGLSYTSPRDAELQLRERVLRQWNRTQPYPRDECIHEQFEAQAARSPEATALEHEGQRLSYRELNERANRLARRLRALGVGPDERVAVCLPRGVPLVVSLLGVLKAGGAFVPIDPSYPRERVRYLLEDVSPKVLLTEAELSEMEQDEAWLSESAADLDRASTGVTPTGSSSSPSPRSATPSSTRPSATT